MLDEIPNFLALSDTLLSGGMPTADQMTAVAAAGVQFVVNLAPYDAENDLRDEAAVVESLGMSYLNIPVDWESPKMQDLATFMDAMDQNRDRKTLVHCRANYRATGFIALYRVLRLGWEPNEAFKYVRRVWKPEDYPVWQEFVQTTLAAKG